MNGVVVAVVVAFVFFFSNSALESGKELSAFGIGWKTNSDKVHQLRIHLPFTEEDEKEKRHSHTHTLAPVLYSNGDEHGNVLSTWHT